MGRKPIYTKKEFLTAYKAANSAKELAILLEISIPTVFNYLKKYKLKPYQLSNQKDSLSFKIAKALTFDVTTKDLAIKFELSPTTIRYHLCKFIFYPKIYSLSTEWAPPKVPMHIKIINALIINPTDNPRKLLGLNLPGITPKLLNDYWKYATGFTLEHYKE